MPLNITIYATQAQVLSKDELQKLAPDARIDYQAPQSNNPSSITFQWDTVGMTINVMPSNAIPQHRMGLMGFVQQMGASPDVVKKLSATKQVLACIIPDGIDDPSRLKKLILGVVSAYDAYFLAANAFYNADNRFVVGMSNAPKQFFPPDLPSETELSLARKKRSIELLKAKNIPIIEHLPIIEDENHVQLRSPEDTVYRAICLAIVATHGSSPNVSIAKDFVADYQLSNHLTPLEKVFLQQAQPEQDLQVNMSWHYEACYVLMWATGFVESLAEPDDVCNIQALIDFIRFKSLDELITQAKLRDATTILDEADLIYRYGWASLNARYQGQAPPKGIHPSVVYERHYALNWLRRYGDADWDDVSTDT